jgi:hypothetical protein
VGGTIFQSMNFLGWAIVIGKGRHLYMILFYSVYSCSGCGRVGCRREMVRPIQGDRDEKRLHDGRQDPGYVHNYY